MEYVAYFAVGASEEQVREIAAALDVEACRVAPELAREVRFYVENAVPRLLARLRMHGADALIVDARGEDGPLEQSTTLALLGELFQEHEIAGPVSRARTWVVLRADARGAKLAFEAGRSRIAASVPIGANNPGWREIWRLLEEAVRLRQGGKTAICLAGGGIEGGFYEMGVLRALQYFLPDFRLQDVDIICGISVGSIIGAFLANGLSPDELMRGMKLGEGRIDRVRRSEAFDPNLGELIRRLGSVALDIARTRRATLQSLLRAVPTGAFAGRSMLRYLERQLNKPGMLDRFTELPHEFYVGATDVDTGEHIVFGSEGWTHVPIHQAVRASSALCPFYAPQRIGGRYYMDGAFTRTTNIRVAVERGATLVILIDPLVPIATERPGYVASKGGVMESMQALKALIHGRFGQVAQQLRARFPHVAFHLFQPDGASMRLMAGSPMKFFYRLEIEDITYRETIRAIRQRRFSGMRRDFERHGIAFVDPGAAVDRFKRDLLDEADEVLIG